jgi:hypothetical protein
MTAMQWHRRFRSQGRRNADVRATKLRGRIREKIIVLPPVQTGPVGGRRGRRTGR